MPTTPPTMLRIMLRAMILVAVLALLVGGLVLSQTREVDAPSSPAALLFVVADTERELTRLPMKYTRIPDAEEIELGNQIVKRMEPPQQVGSPGPVPNSEADDKAVEAYITHVGARVAANAHRRLPYQFHYISSSSFVNAFALPGGHVFIGAGLLALMENEDELAAVLGHEIEHIDHFHCVERMQQQAILQKIPLGTLLSIPVELFQVGYTKDQEFEADREGTRLAVAAGYSPNGAIQIFQQFQAIDNERRGRAKAATPEQEISDAAEQVLVEYFRSHPPSADRIAIIKTLIAEEAWSLAQEKPLEVRYIFLARKSQELVTASKYEPALQAASSALQLHPGHPVALEALAKAACATRDFPKAAAAYKDLLDRHPARADAVRNFAEQLGSTAMESRRFSEANQFLAFSLQLQPDNPSSLKLLAQVKLELGDVNAALESGRKLQRLYPSVGLELNQYAYFEGEQALGAHNYERASRFAGYSLQLVSEPQRNTQYILANSEFMLGHFRAAAAAYRIVLASDIDNKTAIEPDLLTGYADSLGSISPHAEAAKEFEGATYPLKFIIGDFSVRMSMEDAGLRMVAGDESQARLLGEKSGSFAPERAARLGWWYYRTGKFDDADRVLRRFLTQRPGDVGLQTILGWVELEQNAPGEAVHRFEPPPSTGIAEAPARAGEAIARWRLQQTEAALTAFDRLSREAPEWINPTWVGALYGPTAARSTQEMYAELQRRRLASKK